MFGAIFVLFLLAEFGYLFVFVGFGFFAFCVETLGFILADVPSLLYGFLSEILFCVFAG